MTLFELGGQESQVYKTEYQFAVIVLLRAKQSTKLLILPKRKLLIEPNVTLNQKEGKQYLIINTLKLICWQLNEADVE